jgi:hypothetical protein
MNLHTLPVRRCRLTKSMGDDSGRGGGTFSTTSPRPVQYAAPGDTVRHSISLFKQSHPHIRCPKDYLLPSPGLPDPLTY